MKTAIEMARECGYWSGQTIEMNDVGLERFAELARTDEREAVLELVDSYAKNNADLADAIRARGQK